MIKPNMKVPNPDLVKKFAPANADDLLAGLKSIQKRNDLRVVIADCRDSDTKPGRLAALENEIESCRIPLVMVVGGKVEGWIAGAVLRAPICFAEGSTEFAFESIEELNAVAVSKKTAGISVKTLNYEAARDSGIINDSAEHESSIEAAKAFSERVVKMAPLAVRACLKSVKLARIVDLEAGLEAELEAFAGVFETEDMKRGTNAFLAKSIPDFQGN